MANRYFTVDGKTLISSDFPNLTRGFDRVQKDVDQLQGETDELDRRMDTIINEPGEGKDAELVDVRTPASGYTPEGPIDSAGGMTRDMQRQFVAYKADIVPCRQYGFVADYEGTAEYDGLDGTRITCTDNTQAFENMLDDCIAKKNLTVYFPKGHYGIKTGNIQKDLTGCTLTIHGDGMDSTIIDFVKEDSTNTTYVDEGRANFIAKITNIVSLNIKDLTLKATTNYNNINPYVGTDWEYHGAVWGLVVANFDLLRCENVKCTKFNFRGITANNTRANNTLFSNLNKVVELVNCKGIENRGSGFWIKFTQTLLIHGGEYAYNGLIGNCGTGYGVTASAIVGNVVVTGTPYFHHNYRKGIDAHSLCNLTIDSAIFEDNVMFDIALLGGTRVSDLTDYVVDIKATFKHGDTAEGKSWLVNAYKEIGLTTQEGSDKKYTSVKVTDHPDTPSIKRVSLSTNIQNMYNGGNLIGESSPYSWAFVFQIPNGEVQINNSNINLKDWTAGSVNAYNACPFNIKCKKLSINNSEITWLEDSTFDTGKVASLFYGSISTMEIVFRNTTFNLNNCFLFGTISSNTIQDPGDSINTIRTFENLTLRWAKLPGNSDNRKLLGSQELYPRNWKNVTAYVNGVYFDIKPGIISDTKIGGISYTGHNDADFVSVIIDNQPTQYTIEIWTLNNDYIKLKNGIIVTDGEKITLSSAANFTDSDGRAKIKIILKTKGYVASSSNDMIEIKLKGGANGGVSWGIESYKAIE